MLFRETDSSWDANLGTGKTGLLLVGLQANFNSPIRIQKYKEMNLTTLMKFK